MCEHLTRSAIYTFLVPECSIEKNAAGKTSHRCDFCGSISSAVLPCKPLPVKINKKTKKDILADKEANVNTEISSNL